MTTAMRLGLGIGLVALVALTVGLAVMTVMAIDSDRPGEAIAFGLGGFFSGCCGIVVVLVAVLVNWAKDRDTGIRERRRAHPEEPWLWRRDWAERRIEHVESGARMFVFLGGGMVWILVNLGIAAMVHGEVSVEGVPGFVLFLVIFLAPGLVMLGLAVRAAIRRGRYGRSVLELETLPGVLGGQLRGVVLAPAGLQSGGDVDLALDCIRVMSSLRPGRGTSQFIEWRVEKAVALGGPAGAISISLEIPFDCSESTPPRETGALAPERSTFTKRYKWMLEVSARTPGVDYSATFEVPVFKTADSNPDQLRGVVEAGTASARIEPITGIRILPLTMGGIAVVYPRPRWLAPWLMASAIPLAAAGLSSVLSGASGLALVGNLAIGGAISCVVFAITLLGLMMTTTRLEILADTVKLKTGLGSLGWTRRIARPDITDVTFDTVQSGRRSRCHLRARLASGSRCTVGHVATVEEAEWLIAQLRTHLGITGEG
jgi:hypothetical protein